ncbi:HNH endonuclease [Salana multivorans]|uniref:HNH endonuclease n=1 Tax=Salana multivorans TaxID=120377 RepID=A0A3N2D015_9MICO|nr:HNH endonuclease [Salana multivorans]MBN8881789.1 HNH endonuclease [Salana multivorans]OJX94781.1 MAG: endonuclease [Micrococcales bacterium 73-15]ROR93096.1 HNH endonuclease [Salana multivorans]
MATRRQLVHSRRRRRRVRAAPNDLTTAQWEYLLRTWGGCAYCGATASDLQKDCVQPISRGGAYTLDNVVPACRSCNASKCNAEVTGWLRRRRYDERAFLERWVAIRLELDELGMASLVGEPAEVQPDLT